MRVLLLGKSKVKCLMGNRHRKAKNIVEPHPSNIPKVVEFSDAEWTEIANSIDLPKDARVRVGGCLAIFKSLRVANTTSLTTKRSVEKIRRHAAKLGHEVRRLIADPTFFNAGQSLWSQRARPERSDFDKLLSSLEELDAKMEATQLRRRCCPGASQRGTLISLCKC